MMRTTDSSGVGYHSLQSDTSEATPDLHSSYLDATRASDQLVSTMTFGLGAQQLAENFRQCAALTDTDRPLSDVARRIHQDCLPEAAQASMTEGFAGMITADWIAAVGGVGSWPGGEDTGLEEAIGIICRLRSMAVMEDHADHVSRLAADHPPTIEILRDIESCINGYGSIPDSDMLVVRLHADDPQTFVITKESRVETNSRVQLFATMKSIAPRANNDRFVLPRHVARLEWLLQQRTAEDQSTMEAKFRKSIRERALKVRKAALIKESQSVQQSRTLDSRGVNRF